MTQFTGEHRKILAEARRFRPECVLSVGDVSHYRHPLLWRRGDVSPWFARDENWENASFYSGNGGDHSLDRTLLICVALSESRILGLDSPETRWVDEIAKANGIEVTWRKPSSVMMPKTIVKTDVYGSAMTLDDMFGMPNRDDVFFKYAQSIYEQSLKQMADMIMPFCADREFPKTQKAPEEKRKWDSESIASAAVLVKPDPFELDRRIAAAMVEHDAKQKAARTGPLKNRDRYGQLIGGGWETDCDEP